VGDHQRIRGVVCFLPLFASFAHSGQWCDDFGMENGYITFADAKNKDGSAAAAAMAELKGRVRQGAHHGRIGT
jgi:hypothetical protein